MTRQRRLKKSISLMKRYDISPKFISLYTKIGLRTVQYWIAEDRLPSPEMQDKIDEILGAIDTMFRVHK